MGIDNDKIKLNNLRVIICHNRFNCREGAILFCSSNITIDVKSAMKTESICNTEGQYNF